MRFSFTLHEIRCTDLEERAMSDITISGVTISAWIAIPVAFFIWVTVFLFFKKRLFVVISKMAAGTKTQLDDLFVKSLDFPLTLLIFSSGGALVERMVPVASEIGRASWRERV